MKEQRREFIPNRIQRRVDLHGYGGNIRRLVESHVPVSETDIAGRRRKILERQTFRLSQDRIR